MRETGPRRRASTLRLWLLAAALLVAVVGGQSDHGGPPGHEGGEGHEGGPPGHEGGEGHEGGPPGHEGHEGAPRGRESHKGHDEHEGTHDGPFGLLEGDGEGEGREEGPPPACTSDQTQAALEASSEFIKCSGLNYEDFLTLVHADVELLGEAATCFAEKVQKLEEDAQGGDLDEADVDDVLAGCIGEVESADSNKSAEATNEFLNNLIGPESKVCACLPDYVEKMPKCDSWARYHHFGMRIEELCKHIDEAGTQLSIPFEVETEAKKTELHDVDPHAGVDMASNHEHEPHMPNTFGPCPAGQEPHATNPDECQNAHAEEESFGGPQGRDSRGGRPEGGGIMGLGMSVLGVVAVGGVIGFGGVWAWGKFQSGTRQPGVRYMAAGVGDNDIGTELGPFGREYA